MDKTQIGDRMKAYEKAYISARTMPLIPTIARLDGKSFHTWTKGLDKPYDHDMIKIMQNTTKRLVEETDAVIGYTQSDEITLVFENKNNNPNSSIFFGGKLYKMTSVLASMCTAFFNQEVYKTYQGMLEEYSILAAKKNAIGEQITQKEKDRVEKAYFLWDKPLAFFDCRVFQVPTKDEAINCLIWREQDATRNSIQMAGRAVFSHQELHKKSTSDIQEMLFQQKGINWNNYEWFEKRGTYVRREVIERDFTPEELAALPEKHHAHTNPDLKIKRTAVNLMIDFPILSKVENRVEVVFEGKEPKLKEDV